MGQHSTGDQPMQPVFSNIGGTAVWLHPDRCFYPYPPTPPSGQDQPAEPRDGDQQLPVPNERPAIQDLVLEDVTARKQVGIERYGTPLQGHNGRDSLRDLYTCYIRQLIYERDNPVSVPE